MFDRPKYGFFKVYKHYLDDAEIRQHDDVELRPGEKFGRGIGGRRYVFSLADDGKLSVKTQKKVEVWADEEDD